jgi:hypothetical protein
MMPLPASHAMAATSCAPLRQQPRRIRDGLSGDFITG